ATTAATTASTTAVTTQQEKLYEIVIPELPELAAGEEYTFDAEFRTLGGAPVKLLEAGGGGKAGVYSFSWQQQRFGAEGKESFTFPVTLKIYDTAAAGPVDVYISGARVEDINGKMSFNSEVKVNKAPVTVKSADTTTTEAESTTVTTSATTATADTTTSVTATTETAPTTTATTTAATEPTTTTAEATTTASTATETATTTASATTAATADTRVVGTWYFYKHGNEDKMTTVAVADTATQLIMNSDFTYKEVMHLTLGGGQISESFGTWAINGYEITLKTESDGIKHEFTHTYIDGELVHETNGTKDYYTKELSKFPYATEKDRLIGTWTEAEAKLSVSDDPMVFRFNDDGTGSYSWKNDPSGFTVNVLWHTEDDVLYMDEQVEDGGTITYKFSFNDGALVLTETGERAMTSELSREEEAPALGDVDGDGSISAKDASAVLVEYSKLSTGGEASLTEAQKSAADINKDGKTDAKDASLILSYYSYLSTGGEDSLEKFLAN
ncbi:MAG: dockerin type I domain-containing protein, partial [Ruminococcus sp.]|nr:dockerin type I domain-containing protein [Ruminococcus sp.]